jgi:hypothetical protein
MGDEIGLQAGDLSVVGVHHNVYGTKSGRKAQKLLEGRGCMSVVHYQLLAIDTWAKLLSGLISAWKPVAIAPTALEFQKASTSKSLLDNNVLVYSS